MTTNIKTQETNTNKKDIYEIYQYERCPICLDEITFKNRLKMKCGHPICNECCRYYYKDNKYETISFHMDIDSDVETIDTKIPKKNIICPYCRNNESLDSYKRKMIYTRFIDKAYKKIIETMERMKNIEVIDEEMKTKNREIKINIEYINNIIEKLYGKKKNYIIDKNKEILISCRYKCDIDKNIEEIRELIN